LRWREVTLNQICTTQYGYTASAQNVELGPKFLRITDIVGPTIDWSTVPFCEIDESLISRYRLEPGDIVVARTGNTTGFAKLIRDEVDSVFASYLVRIKVNQDVAYPGFVGGLIESDIYKSFIQGIRGGAAQANANAKSLTLFKFRLPPFDDQKRIAAILSAYDDLIENNRRRIVLLEQAARLLYKEWFVRLRFPGHEHFKITGGIPEGWERKPLAELCASIDYGYTASAEQEEIGPKFLRITDIVPACIDWSTVPYCPIDTDKLEKFGLCEGDIVIARTGATVGYAKRLHKRHPSTVFASYLVRLRLKPEVDNMMVGIFVESDEYKSYIQSRIGGAAQPNANAKVLARAEILVPPPVLQHAFHEIVEPLIDQREILQLQNERLKAARDLLLPRLMNGELAV
jgi:type I restriction enzyme, S subunit